MKLTQCPVCRAKLSGHEADDEPCRRCGTDLGLVRSAYAAAEYNQALARRALAQGRDGEAVRRAVEAVAILNRPETRRTLAAALFLSGRP